MTIFQFLGQYLIQLWRFYRIPYPATNVPIGALLIVTPFLVIVIRFIVNILTGVVNTSVTSDKGGKNES